MLASYCGLCGKQYQSTDIFCAGCGTPRDDTNVPNTTLVSAPNAPLGSTSQTAHSANMTEATAALCEMERKDGRNCGVTAVGRCATCGRAFCTSHQNHYQYNMCVPCFETQCAKANERRREASAPYAYFALGTARSDLLTSGRKPVEIYEPPRKRWVPKKGFFTQGFQEIDEFILMGRGWILGKFMWICGEHQPGNTRLTKEVAKNCLTALMDDPTASNETNRGLVPVRPCSGGYELVIEGADLMGTGNRRPEPEEEIWRELMQAVKQLAGKSS